MARGYLKQGLPDLELEVGPLDEQRERASWDSTRFREELQEIGRRFLWGLLELRAGPAPAQLLPDLL